MHIQIDVMVSIGSSSFSLFSYLSKVCNGLTVSFDLVPYTYYKYEFRFWIINL